MINPISIKDSYCFSNYKSIDPANNKSHSLKFKGNFKSDEYLSKNDLLLNEYQDEQGGQRFSEKEKILIKSKLNSVSSKYFKIIVDAQDKNDVELSSLMYVEGGKYQNLPSSTIEKGCWEGYNVKSRFNPEEIQLILGALNRHNEKILKPLLMTQNDNVKREIRRFYSEGNYSNPYLAYNMQNRKYIKIPEDLKNVTKDISSFSGYGIAEILNSIDNKIKAALVLPITNTRDIDGFTKFDSRTTVKLLNFISKKVEPLNKDGTKKTISFFIHLLQEDRLKAHDVIDFVDEFSPHRENEIKTLLNEKCDDCSAAKILNPQFKDIDDFLDKRSFVNIKKLFVNNPQLYEHPILGIFEKLRRV